MPRPRLQRAATARREKVQLRIREQSFFKIKGIIINTKHCPYVSSYWQDGDKKRQQLLNQLLYIAMTVCVGRWGREFRTTGGLLCEAGTTLSYLPFHFCIYCVDMFCHAHHTDDNDTYDEASCAIIHFAIKEGGVHDVGHGFQS